MVSTELSSILVLSLQLKPRSLKLLFFGVTKDCKFKFIDARGINSFLNFNLNYLQVVSDLLIRWFTFCFRRLTLFFFFLKRLLKMHEIRFIKRKTYVPNLFLSFFYTPWYVLHVIQANFSNWISLVIFSSAAFTKKVWRLIGQIYYFFHLFEF